MGLTNVNWRADPSFSFFLAISLAYSAIKIFIFIVTPFSCSTPPASTIVVEAGGGTHIYAFNICFFNYDFVIFVIKDWILYHVSAIPEQSVTEDEMETVLVAFGLFTFSVIGLILSYHDEETWGVPYFTCTFALILSFLLWILGMNPNRLWWPTFLIFSVVMTASWFIWMAWWFGVIKFIKIYVEQKKWHAYLGYSDVWQSFPLRNRLSLTYHLLYWRDMMALPFIGRWLWNRAGKD